ncbi:hypothetical protein C4573_06910 [Candidatus Woesearchaeota archaeon]|nr:MAG: hypothetical protein C4573_06910 [Candidatus Woesearchaeota archaeon]
MEAWLNILIVFGPFAILLTAIGILASYKKKYAAMLDRFRARHPEQKNNFWVYVSSAAGALLLPSAFLKNPYFIAGCAIILIVSIAVIIFQSFRTVKKALQEDTAEKSQYKKE